MDFTWYERQIGEGFHLTTIFITKITNPKSLRNLPLKSPFFLSLLLSHRREDDDDAFELTRTREQRYDQNIIRREEERQGMNDFLVFFSLCLCRYSFIQRLFIEKRYRKCYG